MRFVHIAGTNGKGSVAAMVESVLRAAGYRTGQIGKYHVAPETVYHFETYLKGNGRNAVAMADASRDFLTDFRDDAAGSHTGFRCRL